MIHKCIKAAFLVNIFCLIVSFDWIFGMRFCVWVDDKFFVVFE